MYSKEKQIPNRARRAVACITMNRATMDEDAQNTGHNREEPEKENKAKEKKRRLKGLSFALSKVLRHSAVRVSTYAIAR